ncbi:MAG: MFS transporter [Thermomicrobiales bacterium]|nr:MFS transporter [Thermomicrobiales bacterium]
MTELASPAPSSAFRRTRTTWAAYFMLGLFAYLETVVGPSMPFLREKLGLAFTMASVHFSLFAAGVILAGITADRILSRIGRRRGFWFGMAGMAGGALLVGLSPVVAGTLLGVAIMGFIGTWALVSNQAVLADLHPNARTVALSESNVVASAAAILAPLAVGGFARFGPSWELALVIGAPVLLLLYWRYGSAPIAPAQPRTTTGSGDEPLPRLFWILWCVLFLSLSVEWCMAYWGADFLHEEVGLRNSTASTTMAVFFIAMITGRMIASRLARKVASSKMLIASYAIALLGFPLFWLGTSVWMNVLGLFVTGLGVANFYPLTVGTAMSVLTSGVDRALMRLQISAGSALLLMPLLVGVLSDAVGMKTGLGIIIPTLVMAVLLASFVDRELRSRAFAPEIPGSA